MNKPMTKPMPHPKTAPRDSIDDIIAGWDVCRPDLDAHHLATVGRIVRLSLLMRDRIERDWRSTASPGTCSICC